MKTQEITPFQEQLLSLISGLVIAKSTDVSFLNNFHLEGYLDWEINKYEKDFDFTFPRVYREFLGIIGKFKNESNNYLIRHNEYSQIFNANISLKGMFDTKKLFFESFQDGQSIGVSFPSENQNLMFYSEWQNSTWEFFIANGDDPQVFHFNIFEGIIDLQCTFSERICFLLKREIRQASLGKIPMSESKSEVFLV